MHITTIAELDRVRDDARKLVTKRALVSAGASVVPVPGADLIVDANILTKLLPDISNRFGLSEKQVQALEPDRAKQVLLIAANLGNGVIGRSITRRVVTMLIRRVGARYASKSLLRFVPFAGQIAAAGISFGAMKLVGNSHIDDCYETVRRTLPA
ncbi:hypothetical protein [Sphingomonas sp. Leaf62]|uniref:hypothetical protein n=1 Tax=Sphingomonas sp. Leaf62 TaxID=1736228 RepID=UPI0006F7D33D|nr:hypothetical protein [Sphingomonas sp. Leaf62]KQN77615.1 hypothetical protein ASE91_14590 [Sphingomonas sp. Leaf62]